MLVYARTAERKFGVTAHLGHGLRAAFPLQHIAIPIVDCRGLKTK
jgi:hypothetical protein